jgi:hypothetical protein
MMDFIKNNISPPGIEKPNRLALFSVVGEVMSRLRKDADKAFYAHFPYLADDKKLEEHGEALLIPHLPNDMPEEYRNRVATASFFLMRAGERAYIMDQLNARFGERFTVTEEFLSIHTKVTELTDDERVWVFNLFDSLVDPNVYLELSELYGFIEKLTANETVSPNTAKTSMTDGFGSFRYDGTVQYDGQRQYGGIRNKIKIDATINNFADTLGAEEKFSIGVRNYRFRYDGTIQYDGTMQYNSGVLIPLEE